MKHKDYISNWISDSLSEEDKKVFEQSEEYLQLMAIQQDISKLKAPEYNVEYELGRLKKQPSFASKVVAKGYMPSILKIAASVVMFVGISFLFYSIINNYNTAAMRKVSSADSKVVVLPDSSIVTLNNGSFVQFDQKNWDKDRRVILTGEAFFDVKSGSMFEVESASGKVTVLGTSFNTRDRDGILEVSCYTGYVQVQAFGLEKILFKGQKVILANNHDSGKIHLTENGPSWMNGKSTFESAYYYQVIHELERQFRTQITLDAVDSTTLFTGSFSNQDLDVALKSVTLPLNLEYQITNNQIVLSPN